MDILGNLDFAGALTGAVVGTAVGFHLDAVDGKGSDPERVSESGGDGFEIVDALGVGLLVDAVEAGDAVRLEMVGNGFVGREHELFDQAVGDVALGARDGLHHSEFVEFDDRLGEIEVDRSAAVALAVEDLGEFAHELEVPDQGRIALAQRVVPFEDSVDRGIGHALGGADDTFVQFVSDDFAAVIDLHDAGEHEAIEVRAKAADVGGELEGKHGHGTIREIDTGTTQTGFLIEGAIGSDVLGNVGDVNVQFEIIVGQLADEDGVVEVASGFSVDGDDGEVAEVAAVLEFAGRDDRGNRLRFLESGGWKMMREMKFADDDFDVDAEVVFATEDLDNFAACALGGGGPVGEFDVDDYAFEFRPVRVAGSFLAEDSVD